MAIRAVAFDLDGTLYSFRHLVVRALTFGVRNFRYSRAFQRVRSRIRTMRPIGDFRAVQAGLFAREVGLEVSAARAWIDTSIYGEWVRSFRAIVPFPGLVEVLDEIARRGMALAVLSDFPVAEKLAYLGLADRFSVAMCSEESGYLKPNPEPFALLSSRLGVSASETLFVGDSYEYDILGAKAAGYHAAHISRRTRGSAADLRFIRYPTLLAYLATL